ncbi:MAG: glycosyltransferase family 9 protein [Sulfuricaulis sp.]
MTKRALNLLVKLALGVYVRLSSTRIELITKDWSPPAGLNSILVFSNTALGDTLLSTPAMVSLKKSFPAAKLTLCVHRAMAPLFAGLEPVDVVVLYYGGFRRFVRTVLALRQVRPQAALLLHSNAPQDIPMAVFSGARIILKPATASEFRRYLSYQFAQKAQHVIEQRLDLVRLLGAKQLTTRLSLPARYAQRRPGILTQPPGGARHVIGFQPGAANSWRMWPAENFAALADRLAQSLPDVEIVITGSHKERPLAQKILNSCATRQIHNYCGKYAIQELPYLVREFNLLVSNDTGTMHLAIALGVPTLCLFGASSAELIGPYQDIALHRIIQKTFASTAGIPKNKRTNSSMKQITVAEVFKATMEMLEQQNSKNS